METKLIVSARLTTDDNFILTEWRNDGLEDGMVVVTIGPMDNLRIELSELDKIVKMLIYDRELLIND